MITYTASFAWMKAGILLVVYIASTPVSSAASWHSTMLSLEKRGQLPPPECQQLDCRRVPICTGMKGCFQGSGVIQQHLTARTNTGESSWMAYVGGAKHKSAPQAH